MIQHSPDTRGIFIPTRKVICHPALDFMQMELPERKHLLEPWLPEQGLTMIHAPRGIGKTFFALSCAYAVGTGGEFLRFNAPEPRPVLYIDGEMSAAVMQERMNGLMLTFGSDVNMEIITPDLQPKDQKSINLNDEADQLALEPMIDRAELVIVDNISTLIRGGKENESESWQSAQDWALRLRASGKSVLFIHHSNKDGKQRGTSRREDVLDTVIGLKSPSNYDPEQGAVFEVHFEKHRGFYGPDAKPFEAALQTDEGYGLYWTHRSIEQSTYDQVCRLANEGLEQSEIAEDLGIHKSTVSRHVKKGKTEGDIYARPMGL